MYHIHQHPHNMEGEYVRLRKLVAGKTSNQLDCFRSKRPETREYSVLK